MRPLTTEEKARSKEARKWANKELEKRRRAIGVELRDLPVTSQRREALLFEFDQLRDVEGLPVILKIDLQEIAINYDLIYKFFRKLMKRNWKMEIDQLSQSLIITHYNPWNDKDRGRAEFYELPTYQRNVLIDLPIVET